MANSNDESDSYASDESMSVQFSNSEDEEDAGVVFSQYIPYQDEPIVDEESDEYEEDSGEEKDLDGLSPGTLAARQDGDIPVSSWCKCEHCRSQKLAGALEYRCCREVLHASGMMAFDGSIEHIKCITEHEDYHAISYRAVLLQVAPLLRTKDGRTYRRRAGVSENEFIRAIAYRWIVRWLCGYMGWDTRRPLPACIYEHIRTQYQTRHHQPRGYTDA